MPEGSRKAQNITAFAGSNLDKAKLTEFIRIPRPRPTVRRPVRQNLCDEVLGKQSKTPETRVTFAAYHQVVVDGDAQRLGGRLDLARHLDVVARGLGIA